MKHVFIVQRSEPDTYDFKGKPILKVVERICRSSAPKAWQVLREMIKKFPPYLPKVEADRSYYLYMLRTAGVYTLEAEHGSIYNIARWQVSVGKEELI